MTKPTIIPGIETETGRIRGSQSLLRDWNKCQYRFGLIHVDNLVRKFPTRPLQSGTLIHAGMQGVLLAHFRHKGKKTRFTSDMGKKAILDKVTDAQREFMQKPHIEPFLDNSWKDEAHRICMESSDIALRCAEWLGLFSTTCEWETMTYKKEPLIEYEMLDTRKVSVPRYISSAEEEDYDLGGKLDWCAYNLRTESSYLFDYKSRKQMQKPESDHPQTQAPVYLQLLRKRGVRVDGTGTIQIRRALPEAPRQNATKPKGETKYPMSRASIVCDWETYEKALLDAGLDPKHYQDMREKLKPFFSISYENRSQREVDEVMRDFDRGMRDILTTDPNEYYRQRYPMNCNQCDMEELCTAELLGHDTDFLRATAYVDKRKPAWVPQMTTDDESELDDEDFSYGGEP